MNIFSFEYGDLSGDGHDERDIVWLKTDLTKEEFEQCLDGIKSELGFDFDDDIFVAAEDDVLPVELIDYLKENKFDFIENILQAQIDKVHFTIDFFIPLIIFLEETPNPLPNISRYWGYGLFTWG
jgi:hypothetical protein